jgi:hypothetical protein
MKTAHKNGKHIPFFAFLKVQAANEWSNEIQPLRDSMIAPSAQQYKAAHLNTT